jgi:AcrR family transcriptional regulator
LTVLRYAAENLDIVKIKRPYHHGALREALVDAAAQLLAEDGPAGVSLRAVARHAGVSQAAPYHYFPSKAALIAAVADAGFASLDAQQTRAIARSRSDPMANLHALVASYIRFALEHPHYFHAMSPRVSEPFADAVRAARQAAGHDDLDPAAIATLIWSVPHGLVALHLDPRSARDHLAPVEIERLARAATSALVAMPAEDVAAEWAI